MRRTTLLWALLLCLPATTIADEEKVAAKSDTAAQVDLMSQTPEQVSAKNANCMSTNCHTTTDSTTMHEADIPLACIDCHGGNPDTREKDLAHVQPKQKDIFKTSANPVRSNTSILNEDPEFVKFMNPSDLRVAEETCGQSSCHQQEVHRVQRSMMTHGGSLWAAALYNNGAIPVKNAYFGESYSKDGKPQAIVRKTQPTAEETAKKGILGFLNPLIRWETSQPSNILRIFERGGRKQLELGTFNPFEQDPPGKPERRLSQRGPGTLNRTDPVFIGLQKTRLYGPILSFPGTNDNPGDYRQGGCAGCHVIYANDRDPSHSGPWAKYGHLGLTATTDPTIPKKERGHPIEHKFTRAIPSSQCIVCHLHPGTNMVMTYYGSMWWDNETDGIEMYPSEAKHPSPEEQVYKIEATNPEGSAVRGKWSDDTFLENLTDLNPKLKKTQFADFHGHGWVFRNIYKQDKKGNLLDARNKVVPWDDPDKFKKAVHLADIHLEKGMHCVDCHFEQDVHGNGELYGEVRNTIEIDCIDCHGSIAKFADPSDKKFETSGPAGPNKMSRYQNTPFGPRFFKKDGKLIQRSSVTKDLEWVVVQTRDTVDPDSSHYSEASRLAKTMRKDGKSWGSVPEEGKGQTELAHADESMTCFACHSSWMTSCFGCHLPQQANRRTPMLHNEGETLRNWTSYNYQVLRDDVFMLGKDGSVIGGRIAPVRSSSALVVSSQNSNREWVYSQQQTISAEGFAGQAFNTHVPHTVRATETKVCRDCHISDKGDNNAEMAQLLLLGTNLVNFMGRYAYVGMGDHGLEAVVVTERDEPQAVIGSELHSLAYPDRFRARTKEHHRQLQEAYEHPGNDIGDVSWLWGKKREVKSIQLRGEYLYAATGSGGLRVYDMANIDQKGFSERIVTAPVSPLGQQLYVPTKDATAVAAPTTLGVDPLRSRRPENEEQAVHAIYGYLFVTDAEEGLILVGAGTLLDGNPDNNFLERALTYNPDEVLKGARAIAIIGTYAYIACDRGLVVVDLNDPTHPKITAEIGAPHVRDVKAIAWLFRYGFVVDEIGLKVLDITDLAHPKIVEGAQVTLAEAKDVYVARTYAYVAAGRQGLAIIDIENPEKPKLEQTWNADGEMNDAHAVEIGMTNASLFAYVADGHNGLRVLQLTSPTHTPGNFGFAAKPSPKIVATYHTHGPAIALSKGLDRDRAVDESGNQVAVFGRRGGRPMALDEMRRLYMRDGKVYTVTDAPPDGGTELPFREEKKEVATVKEPPVRGPRGGTPAETGGVQLKKREGGVELRSGAGSGVELREPSDGGGVELKE